LEFDGIDGSAEVAPGIFDRPFLGVAHPVSDPGECLLDRVEVGRIGRQAAEMGIGAADGVADDPALMAAEIVEDDEVAGPECRNQKLLCS